MFNQSSVRPSHGAVPVASPDPSIPWHVLRTRSRHEKVVANALASNAVSHRLPLYSALHHWKDRKKRVELPLFPGYVFFSCAAAALPRVVRIPGVVEVLRHGGAPAVLNESDVRLILNPQLESGKAVPYPDLAAGARVRVLHGPFAGLEGVIQKLGNDYRLVVSVSLLGVSASLEIDADEVERLRPA